MYNILLATPFSLLACGLEDLLKKGIGEETHIQRSVSFAETVKVLNAGQIQLLILDLETTGPESPRTIEKLPISYPSIKVIVLYENFERRFFNALYRNGVSAVLNKKTSIKDINICITNVYNNILFIEDIALTNFVKPPKKAKGKMVTLTEREMTITKLLLEGKNNIQISKILSLHPSTISIFKASVFKKLKVKNLLELEIVAISNVRMN